MDYATKREIQDQALTTVRQAINAVALDDDLNQQAVKLVREFQAIAPADMPDLYQDRGFDQGVKSGNYWYALHQALRILQ